MTLVLMIAIAGFGIYMAAKELGRGVGYREGFRDALDDAGYLVTLRVTDEAQREAANVARWN